MNTILQLSLTTKWWKMTVPGIKTEDYRELTPYWYSRLCLYDGKKKSQKFWEFAPFNTMDFDSSKVTFKLFDANIMTLGYPKSTDLDRIIKFKHKGIKIGHGKQEWGAVLGKIYFVIKHGDVLA